MTLILADKVLIFSHIKGLEKSYANLVKVFGLAASPPYHNNVEPFFLLLKIQFRL